MRFRSGCLFFRPYIDIGFDLREEGEKKKEE